MEWCHIPNERVLIPPLVLILLRETAMKRYGHLHVLSCTTAAFLIPPYLFVRLFFKKCILLQNFILEHYKVTLVVKSQRHLVKLKCCA